MTSRRAQLRTMTAPRRGLRRPEAALYVGVSETKFDRMIDAGEMPQAIMLGGCLVWDIRDLDAAFEALKDGGGRNPFDDDDEGLAA